MVNPTPTSRTGTTLKPLGDELLVAKHLRLAKLAGRQEHQ
jgi:hypothetical protein